MNASIVAIGTEITSGEVVNSNASWLSESLETLGFRVVLHLAVPDDREAMLKAFDFAQSQSDWIFTTGGLGPTTDDFTAEVVSSWLERPHLFSEAEWQDLQLLYQQRGLTIREAHKTQCWFPEGAKIFKNPVGSASAFAVTDAKTKILVLPGPPGEIQGIWQSSVAEFLKSWPKDQQKLLKKWTCLGMTESEVAERVEELFQGSGVQLGYRASVPYVQVKAWFENASEEQLWKPRVDLLLEPWIVSTDGADPLVLWLEVLKSKKQKYILQDSVTGGYLLSRLWETGGEELFTRWSNKNNSSGLGSKKGVLFYLNSGAETGEVVVGVRSSEIESEKVLQIPYRLEKKSKRAQKYFAELAIQEWRSLTSHWLNP